MGGALCLCSLAKYGVTLGLDCLRVMLRRRRRRASIHVCVCLNILQVSYSIFTSLDSVFFFLYFALGRFKYDYMVLDEGHSIKNIKSSRFQRLRVVVSRHRLLLRFVKTATVELCLVHGRCHAMLCKHKWQKFSG